MPSDKGRMTVGQMRRTGKAVQWYEDHARNTIAPRIRYTTAGDQNSGTGTVFPVLMEQTGGTAGSSTTPCTFTYTVSDLDGNVLGTVVTPVMQRSNRGRMMAALSGLATLDADDNPVVWYCDEQPYRGEKDCES